MRPRRYECAIFEAMKRKIVSGVFLLLLGAATAVGLEPVLAELDRLHHGDNHEAVLGLIARELSGLSGSERAQLLWRQGRARMQIADFGHHDGDLTDDQAVAMLEETEALARQATQLAPELAEPWFWVGAAMARRGQIRGVLNSLFMAGDVRDYAQEAINRREEFSEAYFLMGQFYRELPGRPLSFGNGDYAVSLARRAVAVHEAELAAGITPNKAHDLYTQLGHALWKRNHNSRQRQRAHNNAVSGWRSASTPMERGINFDGSLPFSGGTDREEARALVQQIVRELTGIRNRTPRQQRDLEKAQALLADWG